MKHSPERKHSIPPILIIEDDPDLLYTLSEICALGGHRALLAPDGVTALKLARKNTPALILCDLRLPDIHGYEVLRRLRQHPTTAQTPVVFVTGDIRCKPPEDNHLQVLPKPFSIEALLALMPRPAHVELTSA